MPDFVYVGADKCGSSWLFEILRSHPDVFLPDAKDIYFFDREYSRGLDWYEAHFRRARPGQKTGEMSHDYMYDRDALRRIHAHYPEAKIVISLREPVERLWSAYLFLLRHGYEFSSLEAALRWDETLMSHSEYVDGVRECHDLFGQGNVHVMFLEDIKEDPESEVRRLLQFIGVDPGKADLSNRGAVLAAARPRIRWLARLGKWVASALRQCGANNVLGRLKRSRWVQGVLYKGYGAARPTMDDATRARLEEELVRRNAGLESVIGRCPPWDRRSVPLC